MFGKVVVSILTIGVTVMGAGAAAAAPKVHVVSFGKWTSVHWFAEANRPLELKVRGLFVDGKLKEFAFGPAHDVTDRVFVVRRAFRVNDLLPGDPATPQRWEWQPGGWIMVDRLTGRVAAVSLAEFDAYYSSVSWYRDYVAYCGISDDERKLYAVVAQLGRKKPILKKAIGEIGSDDIPAARCSSPEWQRLPSRVTFNWGQTPETFAIRGRAAELVNEDTEAEKSPE